MKVGLIDLLGILFIALKLTGVINWPWWAVISPWLIWIVAVIGLLLIAVLTEDSRNKYRNKWRSY